MRIFFGVGGPNFTSSFHVIGEIFDKVYALGGADQPAAAKASRPSRCRAGRRRRSSSSSSKVPGNYTLVDHALARMERGLVGILHVEGAPNPEIYNGQVMPGMGH